MLALTRQTVLKVLLLLKRAFVGMAVTLAPSAHRYARYGIVIRLEHLRVIENLIAERVQPVQTYANVSGGHPVVELDTILKIIRTGSILKCAEHNTRA